jgi:ABC-type amino acid transport substrate-binding protein
MPQADGTDPRDQPTLPPAADLSSGVTLATASVAAPGEACELVPGYEVLGELGRGGMGVVYRARQAGLNREVALKMVLAGGHAGEAEIARFRLEAESLARLAHPNIVTVYEIGEHGGRPYFSLELCPGGSLERKLNGTPMTANEAAALVELLAGAVHAAHDAGVVHRDLKPANVLLSADGAPKITDFGLAKQLGADSGQTRTGAIMGTPSYMAPEQAQGSKEVGPLADVWALGAILYECLTGRPPFKAATTLDTVLQVISQEPVPPRSLNPAVPRDLETICLKALAKEPARRYASAAAFADDLRRFVEGEPILARRASALGRWWRWARRNRALAGLGAMSAVLFVGLLAVLFWRQGGSDGSLKRVQKAGKLVVATDPTYPPMESRQDGAIVGFDVDLARELARRLGVELELVAVEWHWSALAGRLNAGEFDVLISSVTVTDERREDVDFVEYLRLAQVFVCRKGVAVRSEADLAGKVIAVQRDTTAHKLVEGLAAKGVRPGDVKDYPGTSQPFEAVRKGEADVTCAHEPVARHFVSRSPELRVTGEIGHYMDRDPVGIGCRKGDKELQDALGKALHAMRQDGAMDRLLQKWFGR